MSSPYLSLFQQPMRARDELQPLDP
jgi:hypothetical protein